MIDEKHVKVLANLAKSESLHTLFIKFNNMRSGTELASQQLADSKSLKTIYISFNTIFNHSKHYCEIIEPLIKVFSLCNLIFIFSSHQTAKCFVDTYKPEIDSMVEKRAEKDCSQIIRENFYQGFTALHYGQMLLHTDIIGVIAEKYANATTLPVEYSHDCV